MDDANFLSSYLIAPKVHWEAEATLPAPLKASRRNDQNLKPAAPSEETSTPSNICKPKSKIILSNRKYRVHINHETPSKSSSSSTEIKTIYCDDQAHRSAFQAYEKVRPKVLQYLRQVCDRHLNGFFVTFACFCEERALSDAPFLLHTANDIKEFTKNEIGHCVFISVQKQKFEVEDVERRVEMILRQQEVGNCGLKVIVQRGRIEHSGCYVNNGIRSMRQCSSLRINKAGKCVNNPDAKYRPSKDDESDSSCSSDQEEDAESEKKKNNKKKRYTSVAQNELLDSENISFLELDNHIQRLDPDAEFSQHVHMGSSISSLNSRYTGTLSGYLKDQSTGVAWAITNSHVIGHKPQHLEAPSSTDIERMLENEKVKEQEALLKADLASKSSGASKELERWSRHKSKRKELEAVIRNKNNIFATCERWIYKVREQNYGSISRPHLIDIALCHALEDRIGSNIVTYPIMNQSKPANYKLLALDPTEIEVEYSTTVFKVGHGTGATWGLVLPTFADVKRPVKTRNPREISIETQEWCIVGYPGISDTFSGPGDSGAFVMYPENGSMQPANAGIAGLLHSNGISAFASDISFMTPYCTFVDAVKEEYGIELGVWSGQTRKGDGRDMGCVFCSSKFHVMIDCPNKDGDEINSTKALEKKKEVERELASVDQRRAFRLLKGCYRCWSLGHETHNCHGE